MNKSFRISCFGDDIRFESEPSYDNDRDKNDVMRREGFSHLELCCEQVCVILVEVTQMEDEVLRKIFTLVSPDEK